MEENFIAGTSHNFATRLLRRISQSSVDKCIHSLPPEMSTGNVEYKSQLIDPSSTRLAHLSTQMKWRLCEGNGEAIYEIGVNDDGSITGLTKQQLDASYKTIQNMASCINASVSVVDRRVLHGSSVDDVPKYSLRLLIRKVPEKSLRANLRVAIIGSAESGKSTLCGVLTQGRLDNGKGQTRLFIFRHLHEFRSGKTSSICSDIIGFTPDGHMLNYKEYSLEELLERSSKLITLIDLAGDKRFIKTTIYGVSGYAAHYCALTVNARTGLNAVTKEHFGLAIAIDIPLFIVITKTDLVSKQHIESVLKSIKQLVGSAKTELTLRRVLSKEDAQSCASFVASTRIVPVFSISNVTGENIELLSHFLANLPQLELPMLRNVSSANALIGEGQLFYVEEIFHSEKVGVIVCGLLAEGTLSEGDNIKVGPDRIGSYFTATVQSIHQNKQPVMNISAGDTASIALSTHYPERLSIIRRGMVLIDTHGNELSCWKFVARFYLIHHPLDKICVGFQGTVYIGALRRTATIVDCDASTINECIWQLVTFKFLQQPEFVRVGMPLIFRESYTRGMGVIVEMLADT